MTKMTFVCFMGVSAVLTIAGIVTNIKIAALEEHRRTEASRFEKYLEKWERENYQREQWVKNYSL